LENIFAGVWSWPKENGLKIEVVKIVSGYESIVGGSKVSCESDIRWRQSGRLVFPLPVLPQVP
jgi:hypothetical protein